MKYLDLTLTTPEENLACDEVLLDSCEEGHSTDEILRFWEPMQHFVVVGYANKVATEVNVAVCEAKGIPIYRRCSGGGTVLQGPGCLNYALVLRIAEHGPLRNISAANRFIMDRNRAALANLLSRSSRREEAPSSKSEIKNQKLEISVCGHTDLAIHKLKFSGNSQRRRRRFLLFHGSFLLQADLALISELLPLPSKQPDYRGNRPHSAFLTNLDVSEADVKAALRRVWKVASPLKTPPFEKITTLAREKYATPEWNMKF